MSEQNGVDHRAPEVGNGVDAIARYLFEVGHLKQTPRTGWSLAGIGDAESVADHSFRTAIIGFVLACQEDADPGRTALLCLFHDTPETRLGDIPSVGKRYLDVSPRRVVTEQTDALPSRVRKGIGELVMSYEDGADQEAMLAKDADKLECMAQAVQYVAAGQRQAESWIDALDAELVSESAIEMAKALRRTSPNEWWRGFVENYRSTAAEEMSQS